MSQTIRSSATKPLYRTTQVIWYLFYIIETILLFRFVLKLLGANPAASFTELVNGLSYPLVAPFLSVVPSPQIAGSVLEWSTVLGLIVYWVLAWAIVKLLLMGKPITHLEASERLRQQDAEL